MRVFLLPVSIYLYLLNTFQLREGYGRTLPPYSRRNPLTFELYIPIWGSTPPPSNQFHLNSIIKLFIYVAMWITKMTVFLCLPFHPLYSLSTTIFLDTVLHIVSLGLPLCVLCMLNSSNALKFFIKASWWLSTLTS